jgi:hypothetical protein
MLIIYKIKGYRMKKTLKVLWKINSKSITWKDIMEA